MASHFRLIEKTDKHTDYIYGELRVPEYLEFSNLMTTREVCVRRHWMDDGVSTFILTKSTEHPGAP